MTILQRLGTQFQCLFPANEHGQERAQWFLLALQSILLPITASRTSNLLRTIATVFGWHLDQTRFYTFMASPPKLPWDRVWALLWRGQVCHSFNYFILGIRPFMISSNPRTWLLRWNFSAI